MKSLFKSYNTSTETYITDIIDTRIDIFISILFGITVVFLMYYVFLNKTKIRGPNSRDIINNIYFVDGKYYELEPKIISNAN